ncbi:MAG: acyltransferase [Muribaculum sp.]
MKIKGRCFIGSGVQFDGIYPNLIEIGEGCVTTSGTIILSHFFNTNDRCFYAGKVVIGKRVFIGMNTLIVNAVNIGDDAVIGAGSIVNRDIPAGEIWAGNPAKFIKKIE